MKRTEPARRTRRHPGVTPGREVARRLRDAGLNGRDIARVLDVSPQRVSQLLKTGA